MKMAGKRPGDMFRGGVVSASAMVREGFTVLPGLTDVHVHFREPGFSYKETIRTGSMAAAAGGFAAVCTMPNLDPVPDSREALNIQLGIIEKDAVISVIPFGSITAGEKGEKLSDMDAMAEYVCGFSDDGKGVKDIGLMRAAMEKAALLDRVIAAHCEVEELSAGGSIHDGAYARANGIKGISSISEYAEVERDVMLAKETGCKLHICHVSTKESVDIIRAAKKEGIDVTCETAPHYLCHTQDDLMDHGRFRMNPPLRDVRDRDALIEGIIDGTVDMIATDHAPHSHEEKSRGLTGSLSGVVGLETSFPAIYTYFVRSGIITMDRLVELMSTKPARRFGLNVPESFSVWDLDEKYTVAPEKFVSMGRSTPFEDEKLFGKCLLTVCGGRIVYEA